MEKITYVVTPSAGPKVAGRTVQVGDELLLSEFEARTELLAGSLIEKVVQPIADGTVPADGDERPAKKR